MGRLLTLALGVTLSGCLPEPIGEPTFYRGEDVSWQCQTMREWNGATSFHISKNDATFSYNPTTGAVEVVDIPKPTQYVNWSTLAKEIRGIYADVCPR